MKRFDTISQVLPMRSVRRSGPCIAGGVSPSWYHAWQSITGPVFTGQASPLIADSQCGFLEPKSAIRGRPASSGPAQSQDKTKACRRAPLCHFFQSQSCRGLWQRKRLSLKEKAFMVSPMRGVRRSGPCIMGGVSPSWYHAWQSVTGPVFTGPALPPMSGSQCGFLEPKPDIGGRPASSGPVQSEDMTKACRRAPLSRPSASALEAWL